MLLIDVETSTLRSRGRVDLARLARERVPRDRPLVIVGPKKALVAAVVETVAAHRGRVLLIGEKGPALRTWRAELKRQGRDFEASKIAASGAPIASFVGIDLSSSPPKRTDVTIYQSSG